MQWMTRVYLKKWLQKRWGAVVAFVCVGSGAVTAHAIDIQGVLEASLDQPQINAAIRLPGSDSPLVATATDIFGDPYETFVIKAFFDTGASGVLISKATSEALGLNRVSNVVFEDVGVGGIESFGVSESLYVDLADFTNAYVPNSLTSYDNDYVHRQSAIQAQLGIHEPSNPLLAGLDVFGMPLFEGKTAVFDTRAVSQIAGNLETRLYDSGQVPSSVPTADWTVPMSYGDFSRFTQVRLEDDTQPGPSVLPETTLNDNPFVGPDPLTRIGQQDQDADWGVTIGFNGASATGSWLFDTGAAATIISTQQAERLGITYKDGTYGSDNPELEGVGDAKTFVLPIGGVGGTSNVAGVYLDVLTLPTTDGTPIRYLGAPVLIADISLQDPDTGEVLTLDGVLGMNYFAPSLAIDFSDIRSGAYDFFMFDQVANEIGLVLTDGVTAVTGDFNGDGQVDAEDIDLMFAQHGQAVSDENRIYDFVFDGVIDAGPTGEDGDLAYLLENILHTFAGDANLDQQVSLLDLDILGRHYNQAGGWAQGDFTGDGFVSLLDLDVLGRHYGMSGLELAALMHIDVPEPSSVMLLSCLGALGLRRYSFKY